ncbi:MAG TPA: class I SAM-dependent methyltransferase [Saprospiraceae bacterium]|nr:class I SAM-dependent methyltransferase [Saprospiraceae bacterium]
MSLRAYFRGIYYALKNQVIALDYPWDAHPRYGQAKSMNAALEQWCASGAEVYRDWLKRFTAYLPFYQSIPLEGGNPASGIYWRNHYFPGLDLIGLYALVREIKPGRILEIGSGNSTAVMRQAIQDEGLDTRIHSIDPHPRKDISRLADEVHTHTLESLETMAVFDSLGPGDILFFDGSHLALPNSDVTVFFLEVLPRVPPGVYIQIHDIYLPFDYPPDMVLRGYNEQYLLAMALLSAPASFDPVFPAWWVSRQPDFIQLTDRLIWDPLLEKGIEKHGGSFWFKKRS